LEAPVLQQARAPRLCINILNGGRHAYTNPVLSDFPEYLLVARGEDIVETMACHHAIQTAVREDLLRRDRVVVDGNPVARFATLDNRECLEFLLGVLDRLGLADGFDLMIDASGGDLWTGESYELALTDGGSRSGEEFVALWLDLLRQYPVRFLEDPFREEDPGSWRELKASQGEALLIGDNLYSSDAARIEKGAADGLTDGVIVKPNQAGTVTAVRRTLETARRCGQVVIASHRSISTESTLEAILACESRAEYIKIGPLLTDYSSVLRLNDIIRLTS
jgi:enolase